MLLIIYRSLIIFLDSLRILLCFSKPTLQCDDWTFTLVVLDSSVVFSARGIYFLVIVDELYIAR